MRRTDTVRTGDLVRALGLTAIQEANLLQNMSRKGLLIQIKRGLYLVPNGIPPGGKWIPSPYKILAVLMDDLKARYQVTGMAAFNKYGLETQVPNELTVYNTALSGRRVIAGLSFRFIRVAAARLGAQETLSIATESGAPLRIPMSSLSRSLLDAVYDYERFGTIPKAYAWISSKRKDPKILRELVELARTYGNVGTNRRLGYVLESLKVSPRWLNRLRKMIPRTSSLIPLIPGKATRGTLNRKWGVIVNGGIPTGLSALAT
jgi:predicted transcriptional regulator of viral defense system